MFSDTADSISDFVRIVETLPLISGFCVFRGQAPRQQLLPSISRKNPSVDTSDDERAMLRQLTLQGAALLPSQTTALDTLVAAQHFGMKTRLLDWTSNPLAALWFACSSRSEGDVHVYALSTHGMMLEDAYDIDPFSLQATKVFQPRLNNARVLAQHGWFTIHCFSPRNGIWVRLETHETAKDNLMEIIIPAASRTRFLESLDRLGTNARTLFPDLSGLCQHLNWQHAA